MTDDIEAKLAALGNAFLERMVGQMGEIMDGLEVLDGGGDDAQAAVIAVIHKISGGGGTFGFPLISRLAGDMETLLGRGNRDRVRLGRLAAGLQTLLDAGGTLDEQAEAKLLEDLAGDLL